MSIESDIISLKNKYPQMNPNELDFIKKINTEKQTKESLTDILENAFYGIVVDEETIFNPMINMPAQSVDHFGYYVASLMSNPDYFYFIIKHIFMMDSFPFQCLMLRELFNHRFPLIIGARGLSKTSTIGMYLLISLMIRPGVKIVITGAGFRQAKLVFDVMENIFIKSPVLKSCYSSEKDGPRHGTDAWSFRLGESICYALPVGPDGSKVRGYRANILLCVSKDTLIQTDRGLVKIDKYLEYDCHEVLNRNGDLEVPDKIFKTQKQDVYEIKTVNGFSLKCSQHHKLLTTDGKNTRWKLGKDLTENDYLEIDQNDYFPKDYIKKYDTILDEKLGYLLGLLISIGQVDKEYNIVIKHINKSFLEDIQKEYPEFKSVCVLKDSYILKCDDKKLISKLMNFGTFHLNGQEKQIPPYILQSPRDVIVQFIKGLFAENKNNSNKDKVLYYSDSQELIRQLQIVLLKFSVTSSREQRDSKHELIIDRETLFVNCLTCDDNSIRPDTKHKKNTKISLKVESNKLLPDQEFLYDFVMPESHSFIGNGFVNHNCDEFSCTRNSIISTDLGLLKIEDIVNNKIKCNVTNYEGELEPIIDWIKTPKTDVYRLKTKYGYEIDFSENHKFMLADGTWKKGVNLTEQDYIRFDHKNVFPNKIMPDYKSISAEDIAYVSGLLISEGDLTKTNSITIYNSDENLINKLESIFCNFNTSTYKRKAYVDKRGWDCKTCYAFTVNDKDLRNYLYDLGLGYNTSHDKTLPMTFLKYNKSVVLNLLRGLFEGDGSVFNWIDKKEKIDPSKKNKTRLGVAYYSVSKQLIDDIHVLLKYMGYYSSKNKRKSNLSDKDQWMIRLNGIHALNFISEIDYPEKDVYINKLSDIKTKKKDKNGVISLNKKSGKYIALYYYNGESKYLGSFSTKQEASNKINNFKNTEVECIKVVSIEKLDEQDYLYDISLPSTHSYYANGLVNHNSVNRNVFEEVMSGFLSVAADPIQEIKNRAKRKATKIIKKKDLQLLNLSEEVDDHYKLQNQLILAGTAYYKHNHFYSYYDKWRQIISSGGDKAKLEELIGEDFNEGEFNWKDYSIMRVPIELSVAGFMDMAQINRIKSSTAKDVYAREYSTIFTDDSHGFYRRSLIESCTISEKNPIHKITEEEGDKLVEFCAVIRGHQDKKYVYGIDPAYEGDNFAIVVLECEKDYRKVVHVWTTQATEHKQLLADGIISENDYYHYAARKIRNLMKKFPCAYIAIDSQGGGRAVIEALRDDTKLEEGEKVVLPYIDPQKPPKDTDSMEGDHIIYEVKPSSDWNIEANHSLKKDMEMKEILFPLTDGITYADAEFYDESLGDYGTLNDTLEDCVREIEELKNEVTMIVITETPSGKQKFDTPELKIGIQKKGRLKKDRYSALLMANYVARNQDVLIPRRITGDMFGGGGFAKPSVFLTGGHGIGNPNIVNQFERMYESQMSAYGKNKK